MAVTTSLCNTFVDELLEGRHSLRDAGGHALKLALIGSSEIGTYGAATTNYSDLTANAGDQEAGAGYTVTGAALAVASTYPKLETGSTFVVDFDDTVWASATFSSVGAIAYNTDAGAGTAGRAIAVYSFGGTVTSTNGTFTVQWPAPGVSTGAIYLDRA